MNLKAVPIGLPIYLVPIRQSLTGINTGNTTVHTVTKNIILN